MPNRLDHTSAMDEAVIGIAPRDRLSQRGLMAERHRSTTRRGVH